MRKDILNFIEVVKKDFKLEARYFPGKDVYSLRRNGRGIQNFNSKNFYDLPKSFRKAQIRGILQKGLTHNMGEKIKDSLQLNQSIGKLI